MPGRRNRTANQTLRQRAPQLVLNATAQTPAVHRKMPPEEKFSQEQEGGSYKREGGGGGLGGLNYFSVSPLTALPLESHS